MLGVEGFLRLILAGLFLGGGGVYLQLGVGLIVGIFTVCHLALNVCLSFFLSFNSDFCEVRDYFSVFP